MWLLKVPKPHFCSPPYSDLKHNKDEFWIGSVWKCPDCGKHYEVVDSEFVFSDLYFRSITDRRARKLLRRADQR